ncbi:MAG: YHS domain-containing (seleno)protein [Pseudomonadota bacterium]
MKKSVFTPVLLGVLLAGVAACSAPAETADAGDSAAVEAVAETGLIADLGGEPTGPVYRKAKSDTLAVSGFDVVSYFSEDGTPVEGSEDFTVRYQGYDYRFASEANAQTFIEDPAKYAPAYGGYCAWAIGANDALAPGDPNVYKIVDGTLYLNFSEGVAEKWNKDIPGFIASAETNYPTHSADEHYQD